MSFDLYFFKHKDSQLTEQEVAKYLSNNISANIREHKKAWSYENPNTGTYFNVEWSQENSHPEDLESSGNFENFIDLNFSFNINFFRPTFFGLEIFPIIDTLVEKLDLYVLNPQDLKLDDYPNKYKKGDLLQSWISSNNQVSTGPHEGFNLEYMPIEKSNYLWWYQFHKTDFEISITEDIYIPNLFVIKSYEDNLLYTACAWTTHLPILLPAVDYLIIQKKYRKLFRNIEESGIVPYKIAMEKLGKYFIDFKSDVKDLRILSQQQADKMKTEFNSLQIRKTLKEFGCFVAKDCFVNILQ